MNPLSVLVVDDDPDMIDTLRALLERHDNVIVTASETATGAIERIQTMERLDLVICDLRLGADEGVEILRECRRLRPAVRRLLLTGFSKQSLKDVRPGDADWVWEKDELLLSWPTFQQKLQELANET